MPLYRSNKITTKQKIIMLVIFCFLLYNHNENMYIMKNTENTENIQHLMKRLPEEIICYISSFYGEKLPSKLSTDIQDYYILDQVKRLFCAYTLAYFARA